MNVVIMCFHPKEKLSLLFHLRKRIRALESDSVKAVRKAKDKLQKASKRASETREHTLHRQEQNRMHMASMRESETCEQTLQRKERDRMHKASMRASETPDEVLCSNKEAMANKRKSNVSVEHAILSFHRAIKNGQFFHYLYQISYIYTLL